MAPRKAPGITVRRNEKGVPSYRVRWRQGGGDGPQCSHTYARQAEAVEALSAIRANGNICACPEHRDGPPRTNAGDTSFTGGADRSGPAGPGYSFGEAIRAHAAGLTGVGRDYRRRYERDLLRHFAALAGRPVTEVTAADVRSWVRGCEDGTHPWLLRRVPGTRDSYEPVPLGPVTTRRLLIQAGAVIRQLGISPNPFAGHRVGRRDHDKHEHMKVLTAAEWAVIRDALPAGTPRDFATVLVTTGLRFGEATALRVGDVDLFTSELRVARAWKAGGELGPPKSARSRRTVDFGQTTFDALVPHVMGREPGELLFTAPGGGQLHASNFHHRIWSPALDRAQERGLARRPRLHDLRHTAVSWQLNAGVPIIEVSRRVGHESITTTTDRYGHLLPRQHRSAVDAIERAVSGQSSSGS